MRASSAICSLYFAFKYRAPATQLPSQRRIIDPLQTIGARQRPTAAAASRCQIYFCKQSLAATPAVQSMRVAVTASGSPQNMRRGDEIFSHLIDWGSWFLGLPRSPRIIQYVRSCAPFPLVDKDSFFSLSLFFFFSSTLFMYMLSTSTRTRH